MKRTANAVWKGKGINGSGTLSTQSGVFSDHPYSFKARFESEDGKLGTNPDELIAAANASCFAMALAVGLEKAGYSSGNLDVNAELSLDKQDGGGWAITRIDLDLTATVPDISDDEFDKIAHGAKDGCPVSKVLNCDIELKYTLNK